ncbi:hypothetical protein TEA_001856 [Camellia sinensis var. sinensis]|uniref:HMA domain-containing protein n=1 Tax=Camellia sinensis var. sinensis TaxID=542762 RepID=A0A4S4DX84_CAMSN|nr:hypothetical protein TEA_001856 [Camellia sinensis var. sinensis]
MAISGRTKEENNTIGFKKSKGLLLPQTSLASLESLTIPLVQEVVLLADFQCEECQKRVANIISKMNVLLHGDEDEYRLQWLLQETKVNPPQHESRRFVEKLNRKDISATLAKPIATGVATYVVEEDLRSLPKPNANPTVVWHLRIRL